MRVTKLIKEYITREVTAKYDKKIEEMQGEIGVKAETAAFWNAVEEKLTEWNKEFIKLAKEHNMISLIDNGEFSKRYISASAYSMEHKAADIERAQRRALAGEKCRKIENILLTLELGGTKADLDKMLSEVE